MKKIILSVLLLSVTMSNVDAGKNVQKIRAAASKKIEQIKHIRDVHKVGFEDLRVQLNKLSKEKLIKLISALVVASSVFVAPVAIGLTQTILGASIGLGGTAIAVAHRSSESNKRTMRDLNNLNCNLEEMPENPEWVTNLKDIMIRSFKLSIAKTENGRTFYITIDALENVNVFIEKVNGSDKYRFYRQEANSKRYIAVAWNPRFSIVSSKKPAHLFLVAEWKNASVFGLNEKDVKAFRRYNILKQVAN